MKKVTFVLVVGLIVCVTTIVWLWLLSLLNSAITNWGLTGYLLVFPFITLMLAGSIIAIAIYYSWITAFILLVLTQPNKPNEKLLKCLGKIGPHLCVNPSRSLSELPLPVGAPNDNATVGNVKGKIPHEKI